MSRTKLFIIACSISLLTSFAGAQALSGASTSSDVCFGCHKDQARDWSTTWHSRSHVDSNPLYKAVVNYISRVTYQPQEIVLVQCAQCHNPKMTIKEVADKSSFTFAKILDVKTEQTKKVDASVEDDAIKDGISCSICHNVDKVNEGSSFKTRGFKAVEWGPSDVISGPFEDDGRAGLHKSVQRDHFTNPNKLCMVCHFGGENAQGVETYATGSEFEASHDQTNKCADCHMSTQKHGIITPEITRAGITPKTRDIRSHLFAGARNSDILQDTLDIKAQSSGSALIVELKNLTPHKAPTGFGGRSMDVKVEFKNGNSIIDTQVYTIETVYADARGRETIPYLAKTIKSDNRLNPLETRKLNIQKAGGASTATITVTYRLASERTLNLIHFSDSVFDKAYSVKTIDINL